MNKPVIVKSILWSLTLPFLWVAIIFVFTLQHHRSQIQEQLEKDELNLVKLHFTDQQFKELTWEHSMEFRWNKGYYDVKKIIRQGNDIVILAFEDSAEKELISYFKKGIKKTLGKGENSREQSQLVSLWLKSLFLPPEAMQIVNGLFQPQKHKIGTRHQALMAVYASESFHPPC